MVYVHKNFNASPVDLMAAKWDAIKQDAIDSAHLHEVKESCYRETTFTTLRTMYHGKCAYCERSRGAELQVDHYRPKKARNTQKNEKWNQPGYYWITP